jgi:hypothetical protein
MTEAEFKNIKWTTESPTEEGWYLAYGNVDKYTLSSVEKIEIKYISNIREREIAPLFGTTDSDDCYIELNKTLYTHWCKIKLPEPPK